MYSTVPEWWMQHGFSSQTVFAISFFLSPPAYLFKLVGNCFTMSCWFLPSTMWISHKYTCVPSLLSFPPTPHPIPALYLRFLPCKLDKLLGQVSSSPCLLLFPFPFWWMRILFSLWSVGRINGESSHSAYNPGRILVSSSSLSSTGIFSAKLSAWKLRIPQAIEGL